MRIRAFQCVLALFLAPATVCAQSQETGESPPPEDTVSAAESLPDTTDGVRAAAVELHPTTSSTLFGIAGGWKWPLDDVKKYGDDGFTGWLRFNAHLQAFQSASKVR